MEMNNKQKIILSFDDLFVELVQMKKCIHFWYWAKLVF